MGVKERKLRELEERKNLILNAAKELFAQKSFNNVTIEDIAGKIEISKGTIYSHFNGKEEIYAVILLDELNILLEYLRNAVKISKDAIHAIELCMEVYIKFFSEHREYFHILFFIDIVSDHYRIPNEILKDIHSKKIACLVELQNIIRNGISTGKFRKNYSTYHVALVLWGMINGILHLAEANQIKMSDLEQLISVGFEVVINGLKNIS